MDAADLEFMSWDLTTPLLRIYMSEHVRTTDEEEEAASLAALEAAGDVLSGIADHAEDDSKPAELFLLAVLAIEASYKSSRQAWRSRNGTRAGYGPSSDDRILIAFSALFRELTGVDVVPHSKAGVLLFAAARACISLHAEIASRFTLSDGGWDTLCSLDEEVVASALAKI
jgi:hypothetical protein